MTANNPAAKAYVRRFTVLMTTYVISVLAGFRADRLGMLNDTTKVIVALIPGLCMAGIFWAVGRFISEQTDEFQRMLQIRQALIATGFAMAVASIHGFLTAFDLVPRIDLFWVPVLWCFGLFIGMIANRLTYGTWGGEK